MEKSTNYRCLITDLLSIFFSPVPFLEFGFPVFFHWCLSYPILSFFEVEWHDSSYVNTREKKINTPFNHFRPLLIEIKIWTWELVPLTCCGHCFPSVVHFGLGLFWLKHLHLVSTPCCKNRQFSFPVLLQTPDESWQHLCWYLSLSVSLLMRGCRPLTDGSVES